MTEPFNRKELAIAAVLVAAWLFGAYPVFKAERVAIKAFPELSRMSPGQRASFAIGPVETLCARAAAAMPEGARAHLVLPYPAASGEATYYLGRVKYRLYPREVRAVYAAGPGVDAVAARDGDFVLALLPAGADPAPVEAVLGSLPGLERLYGQSDDKGALAMFRVRGGG